MDILKKCNLCPRNCNINRYEHLGYCGASANIKIAHYTLYNWEEPIISGTNGSGAIFFSNCNMRCLFCQNKKISINGYGKEISKNKFIDIMLLLQNKGAHNINLITPTQYVPQIISALEEVKRKELKIPIIYNTSSYENVNTINILDNYIDIYLADFKYFDDDLAYKYSGCKDYFITACNSIDAMYRQVGKFKIKNNLMLKGLIIRILILPGHVDDSINIIKYLYEKYGDNIIFSIMNQYTPIGIQKYTNLNRHLSEKEYNKVIDYACDIGIKNAFIQEGETQNESFIPNFDCSNL